MRGLPPRHDRILWQPEQEAAARQAREQQEAAARHQEEQEAAARHQEEVSRQARAQEEVERVLKMAMNQGNWLRNQACRIPRLKKAIAAAELSGLPSIRKLLRRAKIAHALA